MQLAKIGAMVLLVVLTGCGSAPTEPSDTSDQAGPGPDTPLALRTDAVWETTDADSFAPIPLPDTSDTSDQAGPGPDTPLAPRTHDCWETQDSDCFAPIPQTDATEPSDVPAPSDVDGADVPAPSDVDGADAPGACESDADCKPGLACNDGLCSMQVQAELIWLSPAGATTPPTWNAHLPKLAGDEVFFYAAHTYYADSTANRLTTILRRPVDQPGAWKVSAQLSYPHQPPGLVMDTQDRLHMVFVCQRPGAEDVTCFQGGAGTAGLVRRFYHLIFSAHHADGSLKFDTYANYNEWAADTNGYLGVGTTVDGYTWWSLADSAWTRKVQWWLDGNSYGTPDSISVAPDYLLYPIHAAHPDKGHDERVLYGGRFDPAAGNNAAYSSSMAWSGPTALNGLKLLIERKPPVPVPGAINAYPSDVEYGPGGILHLLSYMPKGNGICTELVRYADGLSNPPQILDVGCVGNYSKLHIRDDGTLHILATAAGAAVTLGTSTDSGNIWTWQTVPIEGLPANGDVQYFGFTPIKRYTSPNAWAEDRLVFFFSGYDASNLARHSYMGTLVLP